MRPVRDNDDAVMALEATITRQLLQASKAFTGGDSPGANIRADMFIETLADAIAEGGGLGLGPMLKQALGEGDPKKIKGELEQLSGSGRVSSWKHDRLPELPPSETAARVSSEFGQRPDPLQGDTRFHTGMDLAAAEGTPVKSALDGIVKTAGNRGGYGKAVEIDHGNGVTTLYAHNSQLTVRSGETVKAGQIIAEVGHTGRATGPHLHLEVRVDGKPTNPRSALNAYRIRVEDTLAAPLPLSPGKETPDESNER